MEKKKKKNTHTRKQTMYWQGSCETLYIRVTTELSFTAARTLEIFLSSCILVNKWAKGDLSRT